MEKCLGGDLDPRYVTGSFTVLFPLSSPSLGIFIITPPEPSKSPFTIRVTVPGTVQRHREGPDANGATGSYPSHRIPSCRMGHAW